MTRGEKQILLKDLCARLPYGVKVKTSNGMTRDLVLVDLSEPEVRPYLRPMSSMTEEEVFEFIQISDSVLWVGEKNSVCLLSLEQMDWLNAHHFDYRGLIKMGLALEAPEGVYKIE